jgi:hypothetical protein
MQTTQIRYRYNNIVWTPGPTAARAQSLDPSSHASQAQSSVLLKTNCSYIMGAWRWGAPTKSVEEATNRVFRHASRWSPFLSYNCVPIWILRYYAWFALRAREQWKCKTPIQNKRTDRFTFTALDWTCRASAFLPLARKAAVGAFSRVTPRGWSALKKVARAAIVRSQIYSRYCIYLYTRAH